MPAGRFVVKVDTEGFEQTVFREIAAAMPGAAGIAMVFMHYPAVFDPQEVVAGMQSRMCKAHLDT